MRYTTRRQYLQTGVTVAGVLGAGCLNNESSRVYEDTPPETPFEQDSKITFAVLPDTQFYSENDPEVFDIQTKWIAADWVDIDYVIHVGDLVQHWDNRREWERASSSFSILEKKNIPYGVVAGDHDNGIWAKGETDYSYYDEYFGYERFADTPWYGGSSSTQTNHHSYHLFKSDETPFIILYLSFENSRQIP